MNNLREYLLFALTLILLLSACGPTDLENIGGEHESAIVVNAIIFQGDTSMNITLTKSSGVTDTVFFEDLKLDVTNSNLSLDTPDQGNVPGYVYAQSSSQDGVTLPLWKFDYNNFIAGDSYRLTAITEGFETIQSDVTILAKPELINVEISQSEANGETIVRDRFEVTINDPNNGENYYYISATETYEEDGFNFENDYRFYDLPSNPIDQSYLEKVITSFSDSDFNGREHTFVVYGERFVRDQTKIDFKLYQISQEHYDHIQIYERYNSDNPINEPVLFNSNIEGGFGLFAITSKPDIVTF